MIAEHDELAHVVALQDTAGGVGQDDRLEAERAQHAHGEGDLLR